MTTGSEPVPLEIPFKQGGYFVLEVRGDAADGRFAVTRTSFYVLGEGYTAWERFDHNRIQLVPERQTWKPGDTARLMVQSPWEQRDRARHDRTRGDPQSSTVRPDVHAAVDLDTDYRERHPECLRFGASREGQNQSGALPAPRNQTKRRRRTLANRRSGLGMSELKVEDRSKRLTVAVAADKEEFRPASSANVRVDVKDQQGRGTASEVTLWAVDYGVLSLTSYRTPDVLGSVYVRKALQVMNADSRQRIISRRVLTPKGETEGGGGGADAGAGTMRKDFRVLAFWLGSVTTDADGRATVDVKLPESLTTYRIMAVAGGPQLEVRRPAMPKSGPTSRSR